METRRNQKIIAVPESIFRKRKMERATTPEECPQKTFIKLNVETVEQEQQCNGKPEVYSHWRYTEYADDIMAEVKRAELNRPEFHHRSPQIAYRQCCVNFMREAAQSELLSQTTLHLGIYYMDMFMDRHRIAADRLGLVVICCMCIAAKVEECDHDVPMYTYLNFQLNSIFNLSDYAELERLILQSFNWKVIYPTAAVFMEYYIEAVVSEADYERHLVSEQGNGHGSLYNSWINMKAIVADQVVEFLDLTIHHCDMVQMTPSKLAAACIATAMVL